MQILTVNYHYIRDIKPKTGIYPRTLAEFKSQIDELGRYYEFVSQEELIKIIGDSNFRSSNSKYCLVTFDDNLREQLSAYQYLRECKIPAVFYSTTLPYLENQVHDVHKMHEIYAKYSDEELIGWLDRRFNFKDHVFTEEAIKNSYKYDLNEKKRIKIFLNFVLSANDRKKAIDQLFSEIILDSDQFRNELYLPMGELRHLAKEGMLGTHTHSHLPLASIPIDKANREILLSVQYLERMTNVKMQSISYPYGRHGAVNRAVAKEAEKIGLRFGLTMHRGINDMNDLRNDSMLLKRIDTNDAPYGKHRSVDFYPEK